MFKNVLIIVISLFIVTTECQQSKKIYYAIDDVPEYPNILTEANMKCGEKVFFDYLFGHPEAGRWLTHIYADVFNYFTKSWNYCNSKPLSIQSECRMNWRKALAMEFNNMVQDAIQYDPLNGENWLEGVRDRVDNCLIFGKEYKS